MKLFSVREYGSTPRREVLAGVTNFMAMAYIFLVNPIILGEAGVPREAAFAATVWASALSTLCMALAANMPIVLAPGMGVNAFFTYTLVLGMGHSWQIALGAVFLSGLIFFILALTPIPAYIIKSLPRSLKLAIGGGIGLFIALIGFQNAGLVVPDPDTMLNFGDISARAPLLACLCLLLTGAMLACGVNGAILWGILITSGLAMLLGESPRPQELAQVFSLRPPSLGETFMSMEILPLLRPAFISVLFSMTVVDMFNAMGTIIGVSGKAGLVESDGRGGERIRRLRLAMLSDAGGTLLGGLLGTSPVTSYLESITGIAAGGRTGLTALVAAGLFLLCLFFAPLVNMIPPFATAPALIFVGCLMLRDVRDIDFDDITESLPAFLTLISMPLTYSIVTGFGLGFVSYVLLKLFSGRFREVNLVMWIIAVCFAINFAIG